MDNIFNYFLSTYKNDSMEIRKKAKALFIGDIFIMFGSLISITTFYIGNVTVGSYIGTGILLASVVVLIISILLLKRHNYFLSTYLVSNVSILTISFLLYFTIKDVIGLNLLVASYFIGLTLTGLIAYDKKQAIIYFLESIVAFFIFFIIKMFFDNWKINAFSIQLLVQGAIFIVLGSLFVILTISIVEERMNLSNEESKREKERYKMIEELLMSSKDGIDIGEKLVNSSNKSLNKIDEINLNLIDIQNELLNLEKEILKSLDANTEINQSTKKLKSNVEEYNVAVSESSAAIEEMTSSINNITKVSKNKKDSIDKLVTTAKQGEDEMNKAIVAINEATKEAGNILEIIDVITSIASQTDLLAMNAAIEAAHAGDSGKGFAVVADEVRKLAEQTNENIKIITSTLKRNNESILKASNISELIVNIFNNIKTGILEVEKLMEEIIISMQELSNGTTEIITGVTTIVNMTNSVSESVEKEEIMINNSNSGINNISEKSKIILNKTANIRKNFDEIISESKIITDIGNQNKTHIEKLNNKVNEIKGM